ncbi:MurR/RpiR family transcriptional regulator [Clostridia bacterium OttesenSCG-928-O13]|nr:MurR/RpiR family transcriptional regulator [Clostridia bacterium OttesenSCG-928-O13]
MQETGSVLDNIRENYGELFAAEKKIADFVLEHSRAAVSLNVSELAEQSGTSEATVIRFCKHLGYTGFNTMKLQLAHDLGRDALINGHSAARPANARDYLERQAKSILEMGERLDVDAVEKCVALLANCGTVHLVATGNTLSVAMDFDFRLGYIGIRTSSSYQFEHQLTSILLARPDDVVFAISHSGSSSSVLRVFQQAKERGLATVAITDTKRTPLSPYADIVLAAEVKSTQLSLFGAESHIYLLSIIDTLVYLTAQKMGDDGGVRRVEMLLSENKL